MNSLKFTKFPKVKYVVAESINTLCTNISFTGNIYKRIMITSVAEAEGKSFLSMEILRTMASLGKRVILIDADLRRSCIASRYGIQYSTIQYDADHNPGLAHYLAGKCKIDDIIYATDIVGADFIPVGYNVMNSLALLNSPRLAELLDRLAKEMDYIILDTPPVGLISDAAEIAKSCDGAIIAIGYESVRKRDLFETRRLIERSGCMVLGAVLNDVPMNIYQGQKYKGGYGKYGYAYYAPKDPVKSDGRTKRKV